MNKKLHTLYNFLFALARHLAFVYNENMAQKKFMGKIKVSYNAPITLTFSLMTILVLFLNWASKNTIIPAVFTAPGASSSQMPFHFNNALDYVRLLLHIFGHSNWQHLISNISFVLLLGPLIEERYGSPILVLMMTMSAFVSGVVAACFSPVPMLGANDIAFLMILLAAFSSISKNEIPLSFILILILYIAQEFTGHPAEENASTIAHIAGGFCGSLLALFAVPKTRAQKQAKESEQSSAKSARSPSKNKSKDNDNTTVVGSIDL